MNLKLEGRGAPLRSLTLPSAKALRLVQRNLVVYRHTWMVIFSGFFEPLFYLVAVGFGVGKIIHKMPFDGTFITYPQFLAPGMLAASCLNGAVADGFFNPFFKLHYQKTYDGIIATPLNVSDIALGEMIWAQIRGSLYSAAFILVMLAFHLALSPLVLLALPAAMLSAGAFSAGAMVLTASVKTIASFDKVMNLIIFPLFLFSGTFYDVSVYPKALRVVVYLTPLYHSSHLLRSLTTGNVGPQLMLNVAYLAVMFLVCLIVSMRRLERHLIT